MALVRITAKITANFADLRPPRRFRPPVRPAIPVRRMQIPCPSKQRIIFAGTTNLIRRNSEFDQSEQRIDSSEQVGTGMPLFWLGRRGWRRGFRAASHLMRSGTRRHEGRDRATLGDFTTARACEL